MLMRSMTEAVEIANAKWWVNGLRFADGYGGVNPLINVPNHLAMLKLCRVYDREPQNNAALQRQKRVVCPVHSHHDSSNRDTIIMFGNDSFLGRAIGQTSAYRVCAMWYLVRTRQWEWQTVFCHRCHTHV